MTLDDFLYNVQYKRKIGVGHYVYSKKILVPLGLLILYYLYGSTGGKIDLIVYLVLIAYMLIGYKKTMLRYSDKLNNSGGNANIFLYKIIADKKKSNNQNYLKQKEETNE